MAKISEQFSNAYLKTEDFDSKGTVLVVSSVGTDDIGGDEKLVVHFDNEDKGLPLNKTNALAIADICGDDTDDWRGKSIEVYRDTTMFNGKRTPCLRVRAPRGSGSGSR
jgi:hypothetical protein